jgi:hypothetical protein
MKSHHFAVALWLIVSPTFSWSDNPDPTPRKSMDPQDDAQVKQEMAKRWRQWGVGDATSANVITREIQTGAGGAKGCNTTIGPSANNNANAVGSGRYGPKAKPSVTVVTGSVINVCR